MAVPNSSFSDDFVATAINRWASDRLMDQVFEKTPLMAWLKEHQEPAANGLKVLEPLQYAQSSAAGSFTKGETATVADRSIATNAEFDWVTYWDHIAIFPQDVMKCNGDDQKVNLVKAKMQNVEDSLADAINADLWATTWSDSNLVVPIPVMAGDITTTVGGIAPGTDTWWQPRQDTASASISLDKLQALHTDVSKGKASAAPTLIVSPEAVFDSMHGLYVPYLRIGQQGESRTVIGRLGFDSLRYKRADVVMDENCVSDELYMLNQKYLKLRPHTDCASKFLVWEGKPYNQISKPRIVWNMFSLTASRRMSLGAMTNVAA
jgi:hypothetical protein